jgi:hypothetical protein
MVCNAGLGQRLPRSTRYKCTISNDIFTQEGEAYFAELKDAERFIADRKRSQPIGERLRLFRRLGRDWVAS